MKDKLLIVVLGPTAVGKTDLCIALAKQLGTEVLSADSRQIYKGMSIGTAKPDEAEMDGVKHHFVDVLDIAENYNAGRYEREAVQLINDIFEKKDVAIMTGGSGLYIDAVCRGMDEMPEIPAGLRNQLNQKLAKEGLESLSEELKGLDPGYYSVMDKKNPQRVIRALEICIATGDTYSKHRSKTRKERPFKILKVGLEREREELYDRINRRVDLMIDKGLLEEAKALYPHKHLNALQTVGYKEIFDYLDGLYDWGEAVRLLKRNSRRYAKRQMTWFKRDPEVQWFHPGEHEGILKWIKENVRLLNT